MVKVHYDASTGEILGFYPEDIGYFSIPAPTIEIDKNAHRDCINNQGLRRVDLTTLKIVEYVPTITLATAKAVKEATITAALSELDQYIPRGIEDTWIVLGVDTTKLPAIQQSRLALKKALRTAYASVEAATTVTEVESIVIPTEPTV